MRSKQFLACSIGAIASIFLSFISSTLAQSVDCDFTSGSLCGWIVDSNEQLPLQVMQEAQPPPELKSSGGFDSDYVFATMGQMSKSPNHAKMRLLSPYFETTSYESGNRLPTTRCFSFWYRSASWQRSAPASFSFGLQSGTDFFTQEIEPENANVWRFRQVDLYFKRQTDQIRVVVDSGDTYFSYVAFDHFHLSPSSCDESAHVLEKYRMVGGNCPGHYLAQFSEPIGCFQCSLGECLHTCEAYSFCRGVSWVDRKELNEAFPRNSQCYLKAQSCWPDIVKHEGGYQFYERISGYTVPKTNGDTTQFSQFQILSSVKPNIGSVGGAGSVRGEEVPMLAPKPGAPGMPDEFNKWIPRNAKEGSEFDPALRWEKPSTYKTTPSLLEKKFGWLTFSEVAPKQQVGYETNPQAMGQHVFVPTAEPFIIEYQQHESTTTREPPTEATTASTTTTTTTPTPEPPTTQPTAEYTAESTSRYSLVPSPFPSSKHVFGYVPLQPFGNCGGHFIIDENHQYLGCTRCSFAQCATLCSLSEQCRGFSFTESILVAKQCYLKTALGCEPQPSSTGFKYFIKIRKMPEDQVAEASMGRNGIGAFTIKPVMPKQSTNSEQESREIHFSRSTLTQGTDSTVTVSPWFMHTEWPGRRYVALGGNCAGGFLRDGSGEAVTCPRCSLPACQKLCDQDDECRGLSYSTDPHVHVQCYLKTVDTCSPLSLNSGYNFYAKKT